MQAKKPDFKIFAGGAEDGELHDFPDVARGWGVTKLQTNKKPPLSWMNGAFNRVDNNFYYLLQNGLVEWNTEIEYSVGALSQVDGVIYRAKEAVKGENPTASAKWEKLFSDKVGDSDFIGMSQSAIKKELDKKINSSDLTQTITEDKLKAPSNFAVNTALKEQDPRQWGFGAEGVQYTSPNDVPNKSVCISGSWKSSGEWGFIGRYATGVSLFRGGGADGSGFITQIAGGGSSKELGWRKRSVGIWSNWYKIYTTANTSIDPNGVLTTKQDIVTLTTKDLAKEMGNSHSKVMSQKAITDALGALGQPSMTGSATLNGTTDNTVVLAGVVTTLGLEVGDVIRIQYSGYDKLHSVESITDDNSIIVNYEHAGNRGNGSLKLDNTTASVTVARIAKWYNAPIGLGQAWVDVTRTNATTYNHPYNQKRSMMLAYSGGGVEGKRYFNITTNGRLIEQSIANAGGKAYGSWVGSVNDSYTLEYSYTADLRFSEMR